MKKALLISLVVLLTGCSITQSVQSPAPQNEAVQKQSEIAWLEEIYELKDAGYKLYTSPLLDTYIIACALYFDFDSPLIMPKTEEDAFYKEVKAYFEPYKSHQLILDFGKYVDQKNKDVNGSYKFLEITAEEGWGVLAKEPN